MQQNKKPLYALNFVRYAEKMYNYEKNVDKLYMTRYNPFHQIQQEKNKKERMKMKKLCVWALAAMMTVGATGAIADHLVILRQRASWSSAPR